MNNATQKRNILLTSDIYWARDLDRTILVNDQSGRSFNLRGLEAIVWSWLTLGFPYSKIASLLSTILESPISEAEFRLNIILRQWVENGLLTIEENAAHD